MMSAFCNTCRFFEADEELPKWNEGECHIRSVPGEWPARLSTDWCSEHEPEIEETPE